MTEKNGDKKATKRRGVLTPNEEAFVFYLLEGETRRRAYKKAYPNCKATDRNIDSKACKVLKRDRVRTRYETGKQELARQRLSDAIIEGKKAEDELKKLAYDDTAVKVYDENGEAKEIKVTVPLNIKLAALKELKKGYDEAIRVSAEREGAEESGKIDITVSVRNEN